MKLFQASVLLFCLFFSAVSTAADKIEGRILKVGTEAFIHINPGDRLIPLKATNALDASAIRRLESGDFITGQGQLTRNEARLETLYFVGLQRLLGLWRSREAEVFEFRTYEDLRLYWPLDPKATLGGTPVRVKTYSYNVSPSSESHWAMLLVDADSVEIARLYFKNEGEATGRIFVDLLDRNTGQIKHSFQLTQIALGQATR